MIGYLKAIAATILLALIGMVFILPTMLIYHGYMLLGGLMFLFITGPLTIAALTS